MKLPRPIPDASNGRVTSGEYFKGCYYIAVKDGETHGVFYSAKSAREWVQSHGGGMQIQETRWVRGPTDCVWVPPTKEAVKDDDQP